MCSCFSSTKAENEITISFVGVDDAGKTTIVNRLAGQPINTVSPTCGLNSISITKGKFNINVLDLGGEIRIRDIWKNYYHESHAFVFVIDISKLESLDESQKLLSYVSNDPKNKGKPILVLFNKQDKLTKNQDLEQLQQNLKIDELTEQTQCTFETVITCAVRGKNLKSFDKSLKLGFEKLLTQLTSDFEKINKKVLEDSEVHDAEMKEKIKLRNERVQQKIAERELIEAATKNDTTVDNGDNRIETEEQQETKLTSSPEVLKGIISLNQISSPKSSSSLNSHRKLVENSPHTLENVRSEVVINNSVLEEALKEAAENESIESDGSNGKEYKEGSEVIENFDTDKLTLKNDQHQTLESINMNEVCAIIDKMGTHGQQELFEKRCKSEYYFEKSTTFDEFLYELKSGKRVGLAKLLLQYYKELGQEKNVGNEINSLLTNNKPPTSNYLDRKSNSNSFSDLTELSSNDELVTESDSKNVQESPPLPIPQPRNLVETKSNHILDENLSEPIPVPKIRSSMKKNLVHVNQSLDSENETEVSYEEKNSEATVLNTTSIFNIVNMTSTVKSKKRKQRYSKKRRLAERLLHSKLSARSDKVTKITENDLEIFGNSENIPYERITSSNNVSGVGDQILDESNVIPGSVPESMAASNDSPSLMNEEKSEKSSVISFSEEIHGDFKETERKKSKKKSKKNKVKPTISELPPLKHAPTIILSPLHGVNKAFVNDESIDDNSSVLEDQTTPKLLEQSTI